MIGSLIALALPEIFILLFVVVTHKVFIDKLATLIAIVLLVKEGNLGAARVGVQALVGR